MTAIDAYYDALLRYSGLDVTHETAIRSAMQNLLSEAGREIGWTLVPEQPLSNGKRPDGTFRDNFNLARGYWEAKDTRDDLETEIKKKIALGYPLDNMLFEDTRHAVLFQGRNNRHDFDLTDRRALQDMLRLLVNYAAPDIKDFYSAVGEFSDRLPELAQGLMQRIESEKDENATFREAFAQFHELCRNALNPAITSATIEEMLVQHLLTERLFRTIFDNPDFTRRNVIAHEIENVIDALTSNAFNRSDFLRSLDRFYTAIETKGRNITEWSEKQNFLNTVYERFFQGFSKQQADTHGIVYTPQEIVAFMCKSVEHILKTDFGSSLSEPGVMILDPCVGTGNFIVHLIKHQIARRDLQHKFKNDLFANEIMLLHYYIASLNIEHEYREQTKEYRPFEGLCFADTLALAKGTQISMFEQANSARTEREQEAPITVILGNPPYNVGQQNENDNNKNRRYAFLDNRIKETYARASKASLNTKVYDAYVRFFRWATDRLQGRDGIIAFVTNNSFVEQIAFDGMRKHLTDDFTTIYHLDLGGNVRKHPKLSGTTHNVFGIQVGVGITILVRRRAEEAKARIRHHAQAVDARAKDRLAELQAWGSIANVPWNDFTPDSKQTWLTEGLEAEFDTYPAIGTREGKASKLQPEVLFKTYSLGVNTARDSVVYDFKRDALIPRVQQFIEDYNAEVDRWIRAGRPKNADSFVNYARVKWSEHLKGELTRGKQAEFDAAKIRRAIYRPFCKQYLYYDGTLIDRPGLLPSIFPAPDAEKENAVFCLTAIGSEKDFMLIAANFITDLHLTGAGTGAQCFPFYVYAEDGTNRQENITDWALQQFQEAYGANVTKWDIFHFVYAILHDPRYRIRYAENLKRDLPHIPIDSSAFPAPFFPYAEIGAKLMRLHLDYETVPEYRLEWIENRDVPASYRVERMRLSKDRTQIVVNEALTLAGVPQACFDYRLGSRSALEWVLDQYQLTTDRRSGVVSDPNRADDPQYIVRLVGRVITVSLETLQLVTQLTDYGAMDPKRMREG